MLKNLKRIEELRRVKKYNKPIRDEEHNNYNENTLEGIKIILVKMEEQISDLKDRTVGITQSEQQKIKKIKRIV